MNGTMRNRQRDSNRKGFPLRFFAAAFVVSMLFTILSGWQSWQLYYHFEEMSWKHVALAEHAGRIMLLDEVLTMSARMAAATGDFSYEKRYDEFDPQLTKEINEVRAVLPLPDIARFVEETDEANLALVRMERQAFELTHQGKRQAAMALLNSPEYARLKTIYSGGMEKTISASTRLIEKDLSHLRSISFWLAVASALGPLLLLATWFLAVRSARNWVAERREAEDALRRSQDELVRKEKLAVLGQVAGSVGHELRNPLGVMSNAVFYLQAVLADADHNVKDYLNIIRKEVAVSERIVSDLLGAVRTKPPQTEAVGAAELIGQALHKLVIPASVTVKLNIPAMLPPLRVDALQMQQVLRNLISNGVEAMPEGGALEIGAVQNNLDGTVTVSVRDSGSGITPEQQSKLFQPLFTTKTRGIGLGLVVVKNLTQANGGTVKVESKVGQGTTFTVTLPVTSLAVEEG